MHNELVIFVVVQFSILLGFVLGRITKIDKQSIQGTTGIQQKRINETTAAKMNSVKIDDAKFVTKVAADSLIRTGNQLGSSSVVEDDISSSISKLAQLKQRK